MHRQLTPFELLHQTRGAGPRHAENRPLAAGRRARPSASDHRKRRLQTQRRRPALGRAACPPQEDQRIGHLGGAAAGGAESERERVRSPAEQAGFGDRAAREQRRGRARPRERLVERGGGWKSFLGRGGGRVRHDVVQPARHAGCRRPGPEPRGRRRRGQVMGRALREIAGERVVEREAKGVDVGARVAAPAGQHLGGGVGERTGERAAPGDAELTVELGGAEVGQPRPAVGIEQDVLRLDVAMEDAAPVGRGQGGGHVAAEAHHRVTVEAALLGDPHLQVGTAHVFHDDEAPRPLLEEVEHRDDVRVREAADRLHLAPHPLARHLRRGGRRHQQLERDLRVELAVAGEVHDRVTAPPDLAHDLVSAPEDRARREVARNVRCRHGAASSRRSTSSALLRQPSALR